MADERRNNAFGNALRAISDQKGALIALLPPQGHVPVEQQRFVIIERPVAATESIRLRFTAFDASYLERLQRRDPATEEHFVAYFGELIRLKLRSRLASRDTIEEIRQETFVRVLALVRSERGIRVPEGLGALVNSVCNYVLLEHYHARDREHESIDAQPDDKLASPEMSAPATVEVQQLAVAVRRVLSDLSARDRRLLELVVLQERNKDEVCAELGLTRDYLRVLLHRARQAFKTFYLKRFGTTELVE